MRKADIRLKTVRFAAIDFETANYDSESACALAIVRVHGGAIQSRHGFLIRPPDKRFVFSYLHGITWSHVSGKPSFSELWPEIEPLINDVDFISAHNARFDRTVLYSCCRMAEIPPPQIPFLCTVSLARKAWNIRPTKLNDVCKKLHIPLNHHQAVSDATACAEIVIEALKHRKKLCKFMQPYRFFGM